MVIQNKLSTTGLLVWLTCALFFLYEFLLRTVIGTFQAPIMCDLELTSLQYSILSSTIYLVVYGGMQLPVGLIVDNLGLKKSLLIGCIICAISTTLFANSTSYSMALIARMLMGAGSAFGFICLIVSVFEWLPAKNRGFYIGFSSFLGTMGPMLAAGPLDSVACSDSVISWRLIFNILGLAGVGIAVLIFLFVKNNQQHTGSYTILKKPESIRIRLTKLFLRKEPWLIAMYSASVYFVLEYLSENEGKTFIMTKGFGSNFASYMITLSWLGYAIGCPMLGYFSDKTQRRKWVVILAAFLCVVSILLITYSLNNYIVVLGFILLGIGAGGQSVGLALMAEYFKRSFVAMGISLNNALLMLFGALNAPLIGIVLDKSSDFKLEHGDYYQAFSILVSFTSISLVISIFFIKETYCKSKVEPIILCYNSN